MFHYSQMPISPKQRVILWYGRLVYPALKILRILIQPTFVRNPPVQAIC